MHRKSELTPNSLEEPQFDAYVTKAARHLSVIHGQMGQAADYGSDPLVGDVDMRQILKDIAIFSTTEGKDDEEFLSSVEEFENSLSVSFVHAILAVFRHPRRLSQFSVNLLRKDSFADFQSVMEDSTLIAVVLKIGFLYAVCGVRWDSVEELKALVVENIHPGCPLDWFEGYWKDLYARVRNIIFAVVYLDTPFLTVRSLMEMMDRSCISS